MRARILLMLSFAALGASAAGLSDFQAMDADRDGRISAREHAAGAEKMFKAMDRNRDGSVSAAEMDAAQPKISGEKAKGGPSAAEKIKVVDRDGDGVLTAAEHAAAARAMFGKMDADKDGHLSKEEWDAGHAALIKKTTE